MNKRILGIDFGTKTIGLAISALGISMPYQNLINDNNSIAKICEICNDENIDLIVLGLPLNASGTESDRTKIVKEFFNKLKQSTNIEIILIDERYSTKRATESLKNNNYKSSKIKTIKDMNAACVILNDFLESNK